MLYKKVIIFLGIGILLTSLFFFGVKPRGIYDTNPVETEVSSKSVSHSHLMREYKEAIALLNANKFNEAKPKFESYLSSESYLNTIGDGWNIGPAKIKLADCYYYLQGKQKAINLLHEVIATPSFSDEVRAEAFVRLGNYFYENFDQQFARDAIFSSKETRNFLDENNPERSVSNLYNEAIKINPATVIGYYGRGIYYSNKLLSQDDISESDRSKYLEYILNDIRKGNDAFSKMTIGKQGGDVEMEVLAYQLRAKLLFSIQRASLSSAMKQEYNERIKKDFETSIRMSVESGQLGLVAEYQYITWMLMNDMEEDTNAIKSITDDFYEKISLARGVDGRKDMFVEFLKNIRNYPEHHYYLATILIGENDPRMRDFLVGIGWPREAFQKGK